MKANSGDILLEAILSMGITLLCIGSFPMLLSKEVKDSAAFSLRSAELFAKLRTESLLKKAILEFDKHRLPLFPIIHTNGILKYTDGTINPATFGNFSPKVNSTAITFAEFNIQEILKASLIDSSTGKASFRGCPIISDLLQTNITRHKSFLGIHSLGFLELKGKASRIPSSNCIELTVTASKSMIVPENRASYLPFVRRIIPMQQIYTLYLDRNDTLRRLTHRTSANVENQPIVRGIKEIDISRSLPMNGTVLHLSVTLITKLQDTYSFSIFSKMMRLPWNTYILNLRDN